MSSKRIPGCYFVTRREPDVDSRMQTKCSSRDAREVKSTVATHIGQRNVAQCRKLLVRWCVSRRRLSLFWKRIKKSKVPLRLLLSPNVSSFAFPTVNFSSASVVMRPNNRFSRATAPLYTRTHTHTHAHCRIDNAKNRNTQMERSFVFHGAVGCFQKGQPFDEEGSCLAQGLLPSLYSPWHFPTLNQKKQIVRPVVCLRRWCSL